VFGGFEVPNESGLWFKSNETALKGNASASDVGSKILKARKTKTTTAELAKETDDKIVHLGLFVALLGVLSIVV